MSAGEAYLANPTSRPGAVFGDLPRWFIASLLCGAAIRIYLVGFTGGTLDVDVWESHAAALNQRGLISYYQGGTYTFNHPPPIGWLYARLWALGQAIDIPFALLLRLPTALFDAASTGLILRLLADRPERFAVAAAYWLHPLALIFSSHHGNTDSSVAFFLLATTRMVVKDRPAWAGALLGLSLWVKLPGVLAAPVFFFVMPDVSAKLRLCAGFAVAALAGYLPALLLNAEAVVNAVFLYSGLAVHTGSGIAAWGIKNALPAPAAIPQALRLTYVDAINFIVTHNTAISVLPIVLLGWLRREARTVREIAITIFGAYALLYGLTHYWAFQYLAWALPFWLIAGIRIGTATSIVATLYIYGLYAWLCGDPFLYGRWDFLGKPDWPRWIVWSRNVANIYFLVAGFAILFAAVGDEAARLRTKDEPAG